MVRIGKLVVGLTGSHRPIQGLSQNTIRLFATRDGDLVGWARIIFWSNRPSSCEPQFQSDMLRRKVAMVQPLVSA